MADDYKHNTATIMVDSLSASLATLSVFTTNGTYVKLQSASSFDILLIGGGGGGGSGENGGNGSGGLGGCPGTVLYLKKYPANLLATTVVFTVGIGGGGGASHGGNNRPGNAGTNGTATIFGTFIAGGGIAGAGGASGVAIGTTFGSNLLYDFSSDCTIQLPSLYGNNSSVAYNTTVPANRVNSNSIFLLPTGGGAGSVSNGAFYSANSSGSIFCSFLNYSTAIAMIANQTGMAGGTYSLYYGYGGAGGNGTSIGAAGGAGGLYGGGGGGGSADNNPPPKSGAGGNGANGVIVITAYI